MSASREKRTRQEAAPIADEQQRLVQDEAAASRRKTRLYTVIGIVVAVAVAVLLLWDAGVFQNDTDTVAMTVNGQEYMQSDLEYYYGSTRTQFLNMVQSYAQYGIDAGYDLNKSPEEQIFSTDEQTGEVMTYEDYFQQNARDALRSVVALSTAAKAEGYTLSEAGISMLAQQKSQLKQLTVQSGTTTQGFLRSAYGKHITEESFLKNLEMTVLADDYRSYYTSTVTVSDAEMQAYYEENRNDLDAYDFRYAYISASPETKTDADGKTIQSTDEEIAAAKDAAKSNAEALVAAVKAGAEFDAIAKDYVAESSKEFYAEKDYTLRKAMVGSSVSTLYSDWLMGSARKAGDISLFESSDGSYAVVQFLDRYHDESANVDVRHILIAPESDDEEATEFTAEQWAAAEDKAQAILTQFLVGSDKSGETFGALADEHSQDARYEDGTLYYPGGLYANVPTGQMVAEFDAWIFDDSRVEGDTGLVKSEFGWHVMYFEGRNEYNWKITAENALANEATELWIDEILETYGAL